MKHLIVLSKKGRFRFKKDQIPTDMTEQADKNFKVEKAKDFCDYCDYPSVYRDAGRHHPQCISRRWGLESGHRRRVTIKINEGPHHFSEGWFELIEFVSNPAIT